MKPQERGCRWIIERHKEYCALVEAEDPERVTSLAEREGYVGECLGELLEERDEAKKAEIETALDFEHLQCEALQWKAFAAERDILRKALLDGWRLIPTGEYYPDNPNKPSIFAFKRFRDDTITMWCDTPEAALDALLVEQEERLKGEANEPE